MKKLFCITCCCLVLGCSIVKATPVKYYIEPIHSSIPFKLLFYDVTKVTGRFDSFWGVFNFDKQDLSNCSVNLMVLTSSVNTNFSPRDHVASEEILESAKHPLITFTSISFSRKGEVYYVKGKLSLLDSVKTITVPFRIVGERKATEHEGKDFGIEGKFAIRYKDFGIKAGNSLGQTVDLEFYLRFREPTPEKKQQEKEQPAIHLTTDQLKNFEGEFNNGENAYEIKLLNSELYIINKHEHWMTKILPISADEFRIVDRAYYMLVFNKERNSLLWKPRGEEEITLPRK